MPSIIAPQERECERCGRRDLWDDTDTTWRIATVDGEKQAGDPQCLHEWDINGSFRPFE